ncbi:MAG TPA: hypothetical protein VJV78_07285 [Polyangiales bacterium]|nr:hypothetical protein [Polyangiales bacterium]
MGTPNAGTASGAAGNASPAPDQPSSAGDGPISKECRGFDFEGLVYSPGGDVLPNKCKPFHPTTNNPYAVRCIDAWPWWRTEYAGDQFCILPPAPGKGIQLGHHPQGEADAWFNAVSKGDMSGYEKAKIPKGWTLEPGAEEERNINIKHTNEGGNFWRTATRMRGGSHHMIASTTTSTNTFTWGPGGPDGLFSGSSVPGSQRTDDNGPQSFQIPAEDVGLYREIAANVTVLFNMHHFNATDKPILKEAWTNLWWTDKTERKVNGVGGLAIDQALSTFAQPGQIVDIHYATTVPGPVRITSLFGHRHAWTTNFTAWVKRKGKEPEIIYQSFDWFDEPTYQYNSQVKNPAPAVQNRTDGGYSGILNLEQGDELHFNCHIEYTAERAKEENSPVTPMQNGPLRFANEAFTAEMCILFGGAIGSTGTIAKQGPPPDFAKAR